MLVVAGVVVLAAETAQACTKEEYLAQVRPRAPHSSVARPKAGGC